MLERMNERFSQVLVALEFAVLVFPFTVAPIGVLALVLQDSLSLGNLAVVVAIVGCLIPQFAGWRLALAFVSGGSRYLRSWPPLWWWLGACGAIVLFVGCVALVITSIVGPIPLASTPSPNPWDFKPPSIQMLGGGVFAAPLLIPLLHLWLERTKRDERPGRSR